MELSSTLGYLESTKRWKWSVGRKSLLNMFHTALVVVCVFRVFVEVE